MTELYLSKSTRDKRLEDLKAAGVAAFKSRRANVRVYEGDIRDFPRTQAPTVAFHRMLYTVETR